jgi:hypothetical protein
VVHSIVSVHAIVHAPTPLLARRKLGIAAGSESIVHFFLIENHCPGHEKTDTAVTSAFSGRNGGFRPRLDRLGEGGPFRRAEG